MGQECEYIPTTAYEVPNDRRWTHGGMESLKESLGKESLKESLMTALGKESLESLMESLMKTLGQESLMKSNAPSLSVQALTFLIHGYHDKRLTII